MRMLLWPDVIGVETTGPFALVGICCSQDRYKTGKYKLQGASLWLPSQP